MDFAGPIIRPETKSVLSGIVKGTTIEGQGTIVWAVHDVKGETRLLKTQGYLVPKVKMRLLSTNALTQAYPDETLTSNSEGVSLSGSSNDLTRGQVTVELDESTNLPTSTMWRPIGHLDRRIVKACLTVVHAANGNLDDPSKELLRWHYKFGHMAFKKVQFLMSTGVLAHTQATRSLHCRCCNIRHPPKCATCQYAKQTLRPSPGSTKVTVRDRAGILKADHVHPGDCVSVDHFVTSVKGRLFKSRGRSSYKDLLTGACIFVDHASGLVYVVLQAHLNTHETLEALQEFEKYCLEQGVIPKKYVTDNGGEAVEIGPFLITVLNADSRQIKLLKVTAAADTGA